jgi:hypothetical protein
MRNGIRFITVALFALCTQAQAETALGEINIQLYGNMSILPASPRAATATKPSRWAPGPRNSSAPPGAARSPCRLR